MNIEKGKQLEQARIDERNRRESDRLSRNNLDHELEMQEEMILEFDQSSYSMINPNYYSTVYMASEQFSDDSLSETDVEIFSTPLSNRI